MRSDIEIRRASEQHLDFLTQVDLEDEGITNAILGRGDFNQHRTRMREFLGDSAAGWVIGAAERSKPIGTIMCRFRDLRAEAPVEKNLFLLRYLPRSTFPDDGRFVETYQLWVDPEFRRQGLAYQLKQHLEIESRRRDIKQIYTHTEKTNAHVIRMNLNLGFRVVREGPMWDDIVRVSLVKNLGDA